MFLIIYSSCLGNLLYYFSQFLFTIPRNNWTNPVAEIVYPDVFMNFSYDGIRRPMAPNITPAPTMITNDIPRKTSEISIKFT